MGPKWPSLGLCCPLVATHRHSWSCPQGLSLGWHPWPWPTLPHQQLDPWPPASSCAPPHCNQLCPPSECMAQQEGGISHKKEAAQTHTVRRPQLGPSSAHGRPTYKLLPSHPTCLLLRLWETSVHWLVRCVPPLPQNQPWVLSSRPLPSAGSSSLLPPIAHLPSTPLETKEVNPKPRSDSDFRP